MNGDRLQAAVQNAIDGFASSCEREEWERAERYWRLALVLEEERRSLVPGASSAPGSRGAGRA